MRNRRVIRKLKEQIKADKRSFVVYSILRFFVLVTLVMCIIGRNYESAAICVLSLGLFLVPPLFEKKLHIDIPHVFETIIYLFIFAAEILGEINHYYVLIPGWDTMLHTMNGFLCAAIGFSLVDLLNRHSEHMDLSPLYVTLVAFCFSMTVGVVWEFFEFGMDYFFGLDMQKDFIVSSISSVTLDPNGLGAVVKVGDIVQTVITTAQGETITIPGGYLDIGIIDTMKDLLVNFVGAVVFSIFGYSYIAHRDRHLKKNGFVEGLMIRKVRDRDK